jgi:hypothetical protein
MVACSEEDDRLEITVEATRYKAGARVVPRPFFNPPRKTAYPLD